VNPCHAHPLTCGVAGVTIDRMDIPRDLAHRWHQRHDACLADAEAGAGPLAVVYEQLRELAAKDGAHDLAARLGQTAQGLRALAAR
jgi:hypothetical protein